MSGARNALIVANDRYTDPGLRRLRAPGQDAEALARVLGDGVVGGFNVRTVANRPEHLLRREIASFFADCRRDDLLLLHFSCHGVKDDSGQLYFATVDTQLRHLDATATPSEFVNRQMDRSPSRRVVLLLDCCYSGAFARGMMAKGDAAVDLKDRFEGRGRIVLTASSAMEYAFEDTELSAGRGRPSVFTRALVEGLETGDADRDGDGYVSVNELYDYIYDRVRRTNPNQKPGRWDFDTQGGLVIARTPRPRPVPLPAELLQALESPFAEVRLAAIGQLKRLLAGEHAGFALAAATALRDLAKDDSQRVAAAAAAALDGYAAELPPRDEVPVAAPVREMPVAPAPEVPRPPTTPNAPRSTDPAAKPPAPPAPKPMRPPADAGRRTLAERRPVPATRSGRRRWPILALTLALTLTGLAGLVGLRWAGGSRTVAPGQPFKAAAPWRLQVQGNGCAARVSSTDGRVHNSGYGRNYTLQLRIDGEFLVDGLGPGCSATVARGAGERIEPRFTLRAHGDGAGGDSAPFRSFGGFRVKADGGECRISIHWASDGSVVDELRGSAPSEITQSGEFYVHTDPRCTTTVTPL